MLYLITVQETASQLADQFETTDREEAQAWAEDPTATVQLLEVWPAAFLAELDFLASMFD